MRVICDDCNWAGDEEDLLKAPHPFQEGTIEGCPNCKGAGDNIFIGACDKCDEKSVCGVPSDEGYLRLCRDHYHEFQKEEQENMA